MIELTQKAFEELLKSFGLKSSDDIIITKQNVAADSILATSNNIDNIIDDVAIFDVNNLYFNENISSVSLQPNASYTGGEITLDSSISPNTLKLTNTTKMTHTYNYVIYLVKHNANCNNLFNDVDLISIDYVGNGVGSLSLGNIFQNLKEINLSNNLNSVYDTFDGLRLVKNQNIYSGNFNAITMNLGAFAGSPIKKMVLPNSIQQYTIPANCFAGCTELLEVYIPNAVTAIGANAFKGCSNLKYVHIGKCVSTIGNGAFEGCVNVRKYDVDVDNKYFAGLAGCLLSREDNKTYIIKFANNYWFSASINDMGYISADDATAFPGTHPITTNTLAPQVGMYLIGTGNETITCINGTTYTNAELVTHNNIAGIRLQHQTVGSDFLIPIHYCITEIAESACIGDKNIQEVDISYKGLGAVKENAFKGCSSITKLSLPGAYVDTAGNGSFINNLYIGASAFEGCSNITGLAFDKPTDFNQKSFFGCTTLNQIEFNSNGHSIQQNGYPSLCFGNTPNLAVIQGTSSMVAKDTTNNPTIYYNALIINGKIVLGCKNTDFTGIQNNSNYSSTNTIGAGAFYGCTTLNVDSLSNSIIIVEDSAFYGCTSLVNNSIGGFRTQGIQNFGIMSFYGCTGLKAFIGQSVNTIGSKAFANSSVEYVSITNSLSLTAIEDDAFDGCVLKTVYVDNDSIPMLRSSAVNTENSLLKRLSYGSTNVSIMKSGDGKDIVNTSYGSGSNDKPIVEIKSNAFTGVTMNSGDYTDSNIYIPKTVTTLGQNVLSGSKLLGTDGQTIDNTRTNTLNLEGDANNINTAYCNMVNPSTGNRSWRLLYMAGARYFKKLVEDTQTNKNSGYTYFDVMQGSTLTDGLYLVEYAGTQQTPNYVAIINYNSNGDIVINIDKVPIIDYMARDTYSHVNRLSTPITITLIYNNQVFSSTTLDYYTINLGDSWCGHTIPQDLDSYHALGRLYQPYVNQGNAFANCNWINDVKSRKLLSNLESGFKGCTSLTTICANNNVNNVDNDIFNSTVPKGIFDGCTSFTGIVSQSNSSRAVYPIRFKEKAFSGCTSFGGNNANVLLTKGIEFKSESFSKVNLSSINLPSVTDLSADAFKGCNLISAKADSTCGYYFTGAGESILDGNGKIVVGAYNGRNVSDPQCTGIADNAFYGRTYNTTWGIEAENKINFTIGNSAFSTSNISSYLDGNGTEYTTIGNETFKDCTSLTTVVLNDNCTIGTSAFEGCTSLSSLTIPASTPVPVKAFAKCISLVRYASSSSIGANAFNGCSSMVNITLNHDTNSRDLIDPTAFIGCPIDTITHTNNNTAIYTITDKGLYKMNSEDHLELVLGTKNISSLDEISNLRVIGQHAFNGRGLNGELTIPANITKIDDYAFANNSGITYVNIPPTVEYIGNHAFDGCNNLEGITLPDSCTFIGEGALKGCELSKGFNYNTLDERNHDYTQDTPQTTIAMNGGNIKGGIDLTNSNLFSSINSEAFKETSIVFVKLPKICTSVGASSFYACTYLTELHINSSTFDIAKLAFYGCTSLCDIYIHNDNCIPTFIGSDNNELTYVGSDVNASYRHLHVSNTLANNPLFKSSAFYARLAGLGGLGFKVVKDL